MEDSPMKQRIAALLSALGLRKSWFERECGLSNGYLHSLREGGFSPKKLAQVKARFPQVNRLWLMTGQGGMFDPEPGDPPRPEGWEPPAPQRTLPAATPAPAESEEPAAADVLPPHLVPLVPVSAMAGSLTGFDIDSISRSDCDTVISPVEGADLAVPVDGESMMPEYAPGSVVLVKRLESSLFIPWGAVFVLDTVNGTLIKVVQPSDNDDCVRCVSLNPDQRRYAPFDVPKETIRGMYRVLMCMARKG